MPHAEPATTQQPALPRCSFPLPDELTLNILSYLPPRSLSAISRVSRRLHAISQTRSLLLRARLHSNLHRANKAHTKARGSVPSPHDCICNPKGVRTLHSRDAESRLLGASWDPETGEVWALLLRCSVYQGLSLQGKVYVYLHDKPRATSKQVRVDVTELEGDDGWRFEVGAAAGEGRLAEWKEAEGERMKTGDLPEFYACVGVDEKLGVRNPGCEANGMAPTVPLRLAERCSRKIGDVWLNGTHTEMYA